LPRQRAGQPEDDEGVDPVEKPDCRDRAAHPGKDDLNDDGDRDREREQDTPLPEPGREREHEENERGEEDDVAERGVEAPAVVEHLLGDRLGLVRAGLILELRHRVEPAVGGRANLDDDG
jgi:hypothetical protein